MHSARPKWRRRLGLAAVAGAGLLLAACSTPQSALDPQGPFAEKPDTLFRIVLGIAAFVFVFVNGLLIAALVRFRARKDRDDQSLPVQVHGNTRLEILWTLVPALILAGLAVPTVSTIFELDERPEGAMTVEVIGHRWWWEFRYPEQDIVTANEMVIPAERPIRLEMTAEEEGTASDAVIHSFWVPQLAGKQDVVPGRVTTLNLQADQPGRYLGQCAEYCGLSHANMRVRVVAEDEAGWREWVENQQSPPAEPESGTLAAEGKELLLERSCVACHTISGTDAQGVRGPDLTHFASREEFAGAIFEVNEENLTEWLEDPPAMKPMRPTEEPSVGMPDLGLNQDEIEALVAYLLSLE